MNKYSGRLALQQRVLPSYRVPFFDLLAGHCENGMSLFAGEARPEEMIASGRLKLQNIVKQRMFIYLAGHFIFVINEV